MAYPLAGLHNFLWAYSGYRHSVLCLFLQLGNSALGFALIVQGRPKQTRVKFGPKLSISAFGFVPSTLDDVPPHIWWFQGYFILVSSGLYTQGSAANL